MNTVTVDILKYSKSLHPLDSVVKIKYARPSLVKHKHEPSDITCADFKIGFRAKKQIVIPLQQYIDPDRFDISAREDPCKHKKSPSDTIDLKETIYKILCV